MSLGLLAQQAVHEPAVSWAALGRAQPAGQGRDPAPPLNPAEAHLQCWASQLDRQGHTCP